MKNKDGTINVGDSFKDKARRKFQEVKDWGWRNKEILIVVLPVAIGGLTSITKTVGKNINLQKQQDTKELYCYDPSLGHYWKLKRKLSNNEWVEIDRRKNSGENLSSILDQMRVLK